MKAKRVGFLVIALVLVVAAIGGCVMPPSATQPIVEDSCFESALYQLDKVIVEKEGVYLEYPASSKGEELGQTLRHGPYILTSPQRRLLEFLKSDGFGGSAVIFLSVCDNAVGTLRIWVG